MAASDEHGLGYHAVDDDAHTAVLVKTMETTSQWTATRALRAWEREQLPLGAGDRLLDVGCGRGEAGIALSTGLGPSGALVGIDTSAAMLAVAQTIGSSSVTPSSFFLGDALSLGVADEAFDLVRSERTLQWLANPDAAVAELRRVLRPLGWLSLLDTDWSSLRLDVGDRRVTDLVASELRSERNRASNVGARLVDLVIGAGFEVRAETSATQTWTDWDPDRTPAPDGCFSMESLADDLVERGRLTEAEASDVVETIHAAARAGRFSMELTMHGVVALRPAVG